MGNETMDKVKKDVNYNLVWISTTWFGIGLIVGFLLFKLFLVMQR